MRTRYARFFWSRLWRQPSAKGQTVISVVIGVGLAILLIHHLDGALHSRLVALAEAQVRNEITHIANSSVTAVLSSEEWSSTDLVTFQAKENEVATLSTDTVRLNLLRAEILENVVRQVELLDGNSVEIPIGALAGVDLFSSLGPNLPIRVHSVAAADGTYRNELSSAGVNQTLHRIVLDITVAVDLLFQSGLVTTSVTVPVCITETVIIGQPPQTYLNLNQ